MWLRWKSSSEMWNEVWGANFFAEVTPNPRQNHHLVGGGPQQKTPAKRELTPEYGECWGPGLGVCSKAVGEIFIRFFGWGNLLASRWSLVTSPNALYKVSFATCEILTRPKLWPNDFYIDPPPLAGIGSL